MTVGQYFANIYLNELDYYVKDRLKIKYYVRYMDDMVILCESKEEGKMFFQLIKSFLEERLGLELNKKSRCYPSSLGVNFCGYRIYVTHKLVRNSSKKMIRKKIKLWRKYYNKGILDKKKMILSFNSWVNHIRQANSYNLEVVMRERIRKIFSNNSDEIDKI